jgi:hypothetical protein
MARWFNVAGSCQSDIHYMLPAAARLPQVADLIAQRSYFVLHAPRQSGKTTAVLEFSQTLTTTNTYAAAVLSMEVGAPYSDDPGAAELAILDDWRDAVEYQLPTPLRPPRWPTAAAGRRIGAALRAWSQACPRPLVVFLDEIDALQNDALISVLRQLRSGYARRPTAFPWSLALIGLRDVRDYKVASGGSERLTTASPFNIKARSLILGNFTREDVAALYVQHTRTTGQVFTIDALQRAFDRDSGVGTRRIDWVVSSGSLLRPGAGAVCLGRSTSGLLPTSCGSAVEGAAAKRRVGKLFALQSDAAAQNLA